MYIYTFVLVAEVDLGGTQGKRAPPLFLEITYFFAMTCKQTTSLLASHPRNFEHHP